MHKHSKTLKLLNAQISGVQKHRWSIFDQLGSIHSRGKSASKITSFKTSSGSGALRFSYLPRDDGGQRPLGVPANHQWSAAASFSRASWQGPTRRHQLAEEHHNVSGERGHSSRQHIAPKCPEHPQGTRATSGHGGRWPSVPGVLAMTVGCRQAWNWSCRHPPLLTGGCTGRARPHRCPRRRPPQKARCPPATAHCRAQTFWL